MAVAVAVFLRVFFRRTRTGVAMRAVVDDPSLASLAGAPSGRISAYAWMIGVMFAGLGGILLAPSVQGMNILTLTQLVIYGYAAAVVGRLRSLPMTFLGAMILGVANSMAIGYAPQGVCNDVDAALPMAMLFLALLLIPEVRLAIGRVVRVRPPRVASARTTLVGGAGLVVVVVIVLGAVLNGNNLFTMGNALALSHPGLEPRAAVGVRRSGLVVPVHVPRHRGGDHALGDGGGSVLGLLAAVGRVRRRWVRCWRCPCCASEVSTWPWPPWRSPCSWTTSSSSRAPSWGSAAPSPSVVPTSSACTSPPTVPSTCSSPSSWPCASSASAPCAAVPSGGASWA